MGNNSPLRGESIIPIMGIS